jgi:hypothetical protein
MTTAVLESLTSSTYDMESLHLSTDQSDQVLDAYMTGLKSIFILFAASAGCNVVLCLGIGNTSLKGGNAGEAEEEEKEEGVVLADIDVLAAAEEGRPMSSVKVPNVQQIALDRGWKDESLDGRASKGSSERGADGEGRATHGGMFSEA